MNERVTNLEFHPFLKLQEVHKNKLYIVHVNFSFITNPIFIKNYMPVGVHGYRPTYSNLDLPPFCSGIFVIISIIHVSIGVPRIFFFKRGCGNIAYPGRDAAPALKRSLGGGGGG